MTAQQSNEFSTPCTTCRGWSCMKCVEATDHAQCAMDCPDCHDSRNLPEQEWIPAVDLPAIGFADEPSESRLDARSRRGRNHWQAHRIHRLQARCAG